MNIRTIAKKSNWLFLFNISQDINIFLFNNTSDYSEGQITLLSYLNFYASLHRDITLGLVDEIVLKNEIYEDSYMYFKSLPKKQNNKVNNKGEDSKYTTVSNTKWLFKNPKKVN